MGKTKYIFLGLFITLLIGSSQALAQDAEEKSVLASTIIQQKYVKFPWQASGGVFMIVVDAIAMDAYDDTYYRPAYFRYMDETSYITALNSILPDNCLENLQLNLSQIEQTVNKLNSTISGEGHCPNIVYDAQKYKAFGFFDSKDEPKFNFDTIKSYQSAHAYSLVNSAYTFIRSNLKSHDPSIGGSVTSYKKIKDRYIEIRKSIFLSEYGEPMNRNMRIHRTIMSGLLPMLNKMIEFCDHSHNIAPNAMWANLKVRANNLRESIPLAYGNSGDF